MNQIMFTITGQLLKAYPENQVNRETGEITKRNKIQLLGEMPIRDGSGTRFDMVTLNIEDLSDYEGLEGETIRVPFGFFSPQKGSVITYVPKGAKPEVPGACSGEL